jgi:hypothetical protein
MPEEAPQPSVSVPHESTPSSFNIGEEYGAAKKSLPPMKLVLPALALVAVIAVGFALTQRPQGTATGSLGDMASVEVPGQGVMVAMNLTIQNKGEKSYWIKSLKATVETDTGSFSDQAAAASDFARYFEAFPALKEHALTPITSEAKIQPGAELSGTVIVSFPTTADAFAKRKSLTLTVEPYDQPISLVLKKAF